MRRYQQAFTLIELLITVLVLAVLLGLVAPSFETMIENMRVVSKSEDLAGALNYARTEAVRRGARVSVCASTDGLTCGADWNEGFIVIADSAGADLVGPVVANVADVLRVWDQGAARTIVTVSDGKDFVRFLPLGVMANIDNNPVTMTVDYPGCAGAGRSRVVSVSIAGTVNLNRADCP